MKWQGRNKDAEPKGSNLPDIKSEKNIAKMVTGAFKHFPPNASQVG